MIRWPFKKSAFDIVKRLVLWLIAGAVMISGYGLAKLQPYGPPIFLPLTTWDQAIPFLPWTIWLYGTATWAAGIAFLQAPDRIACRRLFFAVVLASCICWVFFGLYPTTYPRHLYPLPAIDSWTIREFADLRASDTPAHCFPSQHVALAWSLGLTWAAFLQRPWAKLLPVLWAVVVSVCTLTTKQHYLIDVPSGFIVGVAAFAITHWGISAETEPFWARWRRVIAVNRDHDIRAIAALRERVSAHQWSLDDIAWPKGPLPKLLPAMERLLNHVIYIEEIAGLNFRILEQASDSEDLRSLYALFAEEERRHADGLRRVLALHDGKIEPPGLGNALVLDQFDTIDPQSDADAALVAVSNPVFETFLDAGTIPFLQNHPALQSPAFDAFVEKVCADEGAHLALNWIVSREIARSYAGWRGLRLLFNPNVYRGMLAVPWMSLDVYAIAYQLGFNFRSLLPAFGRLWRLHERYPELNSFPLWWAYRMFVIAGWVATWTCIGLDRAGLLFGGFWGGISRITDHLSWVLFSKLVTKRGIPT